MSATTASNGLQQLGHLIDGRIVRGDRTFPVDNPKTGRVVAECPETTPEMIDAALAAATQALPGWHSLGEDGRRAVLGRMVAALRVRVDEVVALSELEKGSKQAGYEVQFAPTFVEQLIGAPLPVDVIEDNDERTVRVVRRPVEVVAAISPWNAPILIACEKLFTALAVGNTVVAKPSPFTPLATLKLGEIWQDIVPPGVLNILAGGDETGAAMIAHPAIRMVSFTGSVAAGRQIAAAAGRHLKNVVLELGGRPSAPGRTASSTTRLLTLICGAVLPEAAVRVVSTAPPPTPQPPTPQELDEQRAAPARA